jgi:hypothetical protein
MRDINLCWYCEKRKRKDKNSLFCSKCEKIKKKDIKRLSCENAQRKEFGIGLKGLGI